MPSLRSRIFRAYFRYRNAHRRDNRSLAEIRAGLDRMGAYLPPPRGTDVARTAIDGIPAEWITPATARPEAVLLYLHGGGYVVGSCASHRGLVAHSARACGMQALLPEYRLAPEHPFPAALEDACAVYRHLLAQGIAPPRIVVAGDSAGGGLAVAALVALRDEGTPLPAAAVLLSPWTDLAATGASLHTRAQQDPWFKPDGVTAMAAQYHGTYAPTHPLVSPLYADLHGLPPLLIHVGDYEILLDDSTRLATRARAAGVDVTLKVWEGMWHVFPAFLRFVPEGRQAIREIGEWVRSIPQDRPPPPGPRRGSDR